MVNNNGFFEHNLELFDYASSVIGKPALYSYECVEFNDYHSLVSERRSGNSDKKKASLP